jgi:hypothetical protein
MMKALSVFGRGLVMLAVVGVLCSAGALAQSGKHATEKLRVYFVDVEWTGDAVRHACGPVAADRYGLAGQ